MLKVLIIDDENDLVEMLVLRLEAEGFDVSYAHAGKDGIELAKKIKPNVIILDLIMPLMDGWEVNQNFKSDSDLKNTPVVLATAAGSKDVDERAKLEGFERVLLKPYDEHELIGFLKEKENGLT